MDATLFQNRDAILFWNNESLKAVARDFTGTPALPDQPGPTRTSRALAIIHLAMYDAFNSIAGVYSPYLQNLPVPMPEASQEAAITEAAFKTLCTLYPKQEDFFFAAYEVFFLGLQVSTPAQAIADGRMQGQKVAEMLLSDRQNDGSSNPMNYMAMPDPGKHRPDPLHPNQGFLDAQWGEVTPFGISSGADFVATPPPLLTSSRYERDFNEVKEKGSLTGGTRTPDETAIGLFWGYDGAQKIGTPPRLYNQIVREIAMKMGNDLAQNARLFALVNMAMADAGIQCWYSKYLYSIWRPVVGIREADPGWGPTGLGDGNAETKGDPFWLPLGAPATNAVPSNNPFRPIPKNFSPNFPAYPSGHATFGAAAFDMVRLFYNNDNISFDFVSDELNGESIDVDFSVRTYHKRHFDRLSDAIEENARSRVYLGVHWQFDADAGVESGKRIAQDISSKFLLPLP